MNLEMSASPPDGGCAETRTVIHIEGRDMSQILFALRRLSGDRKGVTALEYGLIAAVMGALIVSGVTSLGGAMGTAFTTIGSVLTTKASGM
jgi:pilus assembly protein Flp/PilA